MNDLKVTDKNRIAIENGDFEMVEEENRLKQHIKTGLKILPQDWVLDYRKGVDYIGGIRAYPNILKAQIKNAIQEAFGVDRVLKYVFDYSDETIKVSGTVLSGNNELPFEGAIGL